MSQMTHLPITNEFWWMDLKTKVVMSISGKHLTHRNIQTFKYLVCFYYYFRYKNEELALSLRLELKMRKEENDKIKMEIDSQAAKLEEEIEDLRGLIRDKVDCCDRLEGRLNDLIDEHQHEIGIIKMGVEDKEEELVYRHEAQMHDVMEKIVALQTKIFTMEHQQDQQQEFLKLENLHSVGANVVVVKGVEILLALLKAVLIILEFILHFTKPMITTPNRIVLTIVVLTVIIVTVREFGVW